MREVRDVGDRLARAQVDRAGSVLDLEDPEEAARFIEEWNAELDAFEGPSVNRLRYAMGLRRDA